MQFSVKQGDILFNRPAMLVIVPLEPSIDHAEPCPSRGREAERTVRRHFEIGSAGEKQQQWLRC
jgi:hypothetical protein